MTHASLYRIVYIFKLLNLFSFLDRSVANTSYSRYGLFILILSLLSCTLSVELLLFELIVIVFNVQSSLS
ncbi:uncharacterized protein B0P05DRAFT_531700 [Gilbertella persicaria]|uniref:uncharacterized protein n=1 Tax=Gilbertella persicaria TaxID=101096 RepID=UPI002220A182|nr:uncharacterized protein B0P05DRAFT_531700 [Gilbertella persicaria]KAI8087626.1 hypothetical protein B0P05DRAFT_531700 [Gilbertella persicaria]